MICGNRLRVKGYSVKKDRGHSEGVMADQSDASMFYYKRI